MLLNFNNGFKKMWKDLDYTGSFAMFGHDDFTLPKKDDPGFEYSEERAETETSVTVKESWKSTSGSICFSRVTTSPKKKKVNLDEIKELIKKSVEAEDYETAAKLKKQLEKMKKED